MFKLNFPDATKEDISRSATVAKVVELIGLRMTKGNFTVVPASSPKSAKDAAGLPPYKFEFSSRFDEKENLIDVSIVIQGRDIRNATGEGAGTEAVHVEAGFVLTYKLMVEAPPEDLRGEFFSAFAKVNGLMNLWPYYREFAHEIARRMGYPIVLVPLLRVEPSDGKPKEMKVSKRKPTSSKTPSKPAIQKKK